MATQAQRKIERIHQRLMDIRDSTPSRRGHVTAEREYTRVYMRSYRISRLSDFYAAAEKYRHFLQDVKAKKSGEELS